MARSTRGRSLAPSGGSFEEMRRRRELRQILENPVGPTAESLALVFGDARDDAPIRVRRDISAHAVADLGERGGLGGEIRQAIEGYPVPHVTGAVDGVAVLGGPITTYLVEMLESEADGVEFFVTPLAERARGVQR